MYFVVIDPNMLLDGAPAVIDIFSSGEKAHEEMQWLASSCVVEEREDLFFLSEIDSQREFSFMKENKKQKFAERSFHGNSYGDRPTEW